MMKMVAQTPVRPSMGFAVASQSRSHTKIELKRPRPYPFAETICDSPVSVVDWMPSAPRQTRQMVATPITVAYGDGTGPAILNSTLRILSAAGAKIKPQTIEVGEKVYRRGQDDGRGSRGGTGQ